MSNHDDLIAEARQWDADVIGETGWRGVGKLADALEAALAEVAERSRAFEDAVKVANSAQQKVAEQQAVIERVRAYAEDRAFHARGHLNTVNSGRIASDLQAILSTSGTEALRRSNYTAWNLGAKHVYEGSAPKCDFAKDGMPCPYNPYREETD